MATITESTVISGVQIVEPSMFKDERGFFIETYRRQWFPLGREMVQGNRGDRQLAASLACTITCIKATIGTFPTARAVWCCTTCELGRQPTAQPK
jgi:hypothetical protein